MSTGLPALAAVVLPGAALAGEVPTPPDAIDATHIVMADPAESGSSGFPDSSGSTATSERKWAVFGQSTLTGMNAFGFRAPYAGENSLVPHDLRETFDATAFLGVRPWKGGELWGNVEVDQGFGIGNSLGLAGYASGEAYKLGKAHPYVRLQRLFYRQTFNLGGDGVAVDAAANQMAGVQQATRLVLTLGKFSIVDVFDTNKYAHDPRGDFLNWALLDAGAFDYAGDAWGYTYGAAVEAYKDNWTVRFGLFNLSDVPGGLVPTKDFSQNQANFEIEHRHQIGGHAGAIRLGVWRNHGRLGRYDEALAWGTANATAPDLNEVLRYQDRWGGYLNVEQELTGTLGAFLRVSTADGAVGAYDFTDIDRSVSGGLSFAGKGWRRPQDTVGLGLVADRISGVATAYFAAGGKGILIGDGQLPHPGTEQILEAYYAWHPFTPVTLTLDYQHVINPAYNRDRGPVDILGLRLHVAG